MSSWVKTLDQVITNAVNKQSLQQFTDADESITGKYVQLDNNPLELLNFGSCSYLGLELHPFIKEGVSKAVKKYGTQFSTSRSFLSLGLYSELEDLMRQIYQQPLIVTASTTLGHLATLPVIVGDNDAVILDFQVHSSVQLAVQVLKARRVDVTLIRHNCMKSLEEQIKKLSNKYDKVWFRYKNPNRTVQAIEALVTIYDEDETFNASGLVLKRCEWVVDLFTEKYEGRSEEELTEQYGPLL